MRPLSGPAQLFRVITTTLLTLALAASASASAVLALFSAESDGGVVRVEANGESRVLFRHPSLQLAHKIRVSDDGRWALVNAKQEKVLNLFIIDLHAPETAPRVVTLDFTPEEHRIGPHNRAYIGGSGGHIVAVNLLTGEITHRWNSRRQLTPPGHKPEDLQIITEAGLLLATHQKDGNQGRQGSRMIVLRLDDLSLVADLPLPRNRPDLHLSTREAGPSPELIRWHRPSNKIVLSLDLYGAIAVADFSSALAGRWENLTYLTTSGDGSWGHSFPDRFILVPHQDAVLAVVTNAQDQGGLAVFDVTAPRRLGFYPMDAGCDYPVLVNQGRTVATVLSGKRKRRLEDRLENITTPGHDLVLLDVAGAAVADPAALTRLPLGSPVSRLSDVPGLPDAVAIGLLEPPAVLLFDTVQRREITRVSVPGRPVNLVGLPPLQP